MGRINLLDCTLRDGGCANDFKFSQNERTKILKGLIEAGAEYIELGYLDRENGFENGYTKYKNVEVIDELVLSGISDTNTKFFAMIDYGKYDIELLPENSDTRLDGIRLCFHKKNMYEAIELAKKILKKGYRLMLQPMVGSRYSDEEYKTLIKMASTELNSLEAFYIVDSFGVMDEKTIIEKVMLVNSELKKGIAIGIHTHNNLNLSYTNVLAIIELGLDRDFLMDGTLYGMGKGAGNMETEKFIAYMNKNKNANYKLEAVTEVVNNTMIELQSKYKWGYCEEYKLSAKYQLTPSYANLYTNTCKLNLKETEQLLSGIPDNKKDSFDKAFALAHYETWKQNNGQ